MILALTAALLAAAPGTAHGADPVIGRWRTPTHNAIVETAMCGTKLCGRLVTSDEIRKNPRLPDGLNANAALRGRPLRGITMLSGFTKQGSQWVNGSIYKPDDGKTYSGSITSVTPTTLTLRGCIYEPLCQDQTWTRVR